MTFEQLVWFLSHPYWIYALIGIIPLVIYVIHKEYRQSLGLKKWITKK